MSEDIVVLYHGHCTDGFGAAYAAWKKFGDAAEYIPVKYGHEPPEGLEGHEIYMLDFCFNDLATMQSIAEGAKKFVVLDHHKGSRAVVEQISEHIFDESRTGATIAWTYFHPDTAIPKLLGFIEDGDLYRFALPETRDVFSYLDVRAHNFEEWDEVAKILEDAQKSASFFEKAAIYTEYFTLLGKHAAAGAKIVRFEGYECYFANAHPSMTMKSFVGHELYQEKPPLALVVSAHPDGFGVSIRGDGSVDVSEIARKYGGNGHPGSAGFFIPVGTPVPWVEVHPEV